MSMSAASEEVRVLIVEDDADVRDTLAMLLESDGYLVQGASSGEAAIGLLDHFSPDCVLLDLGLPGIRGSEVARQLRQRVGTQLVIIAVTGSSAAADRDEAEIAGIDFLLTKPVGESDLRRFLPPID